MTRYLIGLVGVMAVAAVLWVTLAPSNDDVEDDADPAVATLPEDSPAAGPDTEAGPEPEVEPAVEPDAVVGAEPGAAAAPEVMPERDAAFEALAAARREDLPRSFGTDLTFADAVFLPRLRIMEHVFVADRGAPPAPAELRRRVQADRDRLCAEERALFEAGVTLRHSFRDRSGALLQRVHLLPEECVAGR
ncbi:MAG: hypothetical protein ACXIUV_02190 [Alkalilacustris sp.]